jgi:CobQ-like glutamine amidotransferase family enzyme
MELRLLALYPDQMNIYADRGNILFLQHRCEWRGIEFSYSAAGLGERFDRAEPDLIYIGGGQDRDQRLVAGDMLRTKRDAIADLETVREAGPRLIGNIAIEVDLGDGPRTLAGFENHGGRTHLGRGTQPLGRVIKGHGNNGRDGFEGVRRETLFGTYMHGPLLPKNAWLADRLIALAIARREGSEPELEPLDDALEVAAHESALAAAMR